MVLSRTISRYDSTERIANAMIDPAFRGTDIFDEQLLIEELTRDDAEKLLGSFYQDDKFVLSIVFPQDDRRQTKERTTKP